MEIKELIEKRRQLELDIRDLVRKFEEETSISPNNINIYRIKQEVMGASHPKYCIADVKIDISL